MCQGVLIFAIAFVLVDIAFLYQKSVKLSAKRMLPQLLSLGDENFIHILVENHSNLDLRLKIIDELPEQLQERNFTINAELKPQAEEQFHYIITPIVRGEYFFKNINIYAATFLGLVTRRFTIKAHKKAPVYPSVLQMKKYAFRAFSRQTHEHGIKKLRRLGHSYEFDQIKNYVKGDDYRSINWKATGKKSELMVNHYEDEKTQSIYCIIDKSRSMKMPFNGLSLLDHSINSALVMSNIALLKDDKAGLITFSDKLGSTLKAEKSNKQLRAILEALYKEKERKTDANYELMFYAVRKLISSRSLLMFYTNFESIYSLERVLPVLRKINRHHLLVVIFFVNTEILKMAEKECKTLEDIYHQTIARNFIEEKYKMVNELKKFGIHSILTKPEDLNVNTINKYLELKSRGMI